MSPNERNRRTIKLAFKAILNREVSGAELEIWLTKQFSSSELLEELATSEEFAAKTCHDDESRRYLLERVFIELLRRPISERELDKRMSHWQPAHRFINEVLSSEEYKEKKSSYELELPQIIGTNFCVLGESKLFTAAKLVGWYQLVIQNLLYHKNEKRKIESAKIESTRVPRENHELVIITSMYKGEKYIESFLESIVSQTIFDKCLLFIVDANSPENEYQTIKRYQEDFPNIRYDRMTSVVGIYEAWNYAIQNSDSEFMTNANLDDLHRSDALELKVRALKENPDMDVAYSDVFYSFMPNLPFEVFSECGVRTNLPGASKENLLRFNSPHNAPVWRRKLHNEIGFFETQYQSAGDYEFWLRAFFSDKNFIKIAEPVTGYLQNVDGVSTRINSRGNMESQKIRDKYGKLLKREKST